MKKKIVVLLLSAMMAVSVVGCGSNKNTEDHVSATESVESTENAGTSAYESPSFDIKASDYVTLCDYDSIEVTIDGDYQVGEQEVKEYFAQMFSNYGPFYKADETKTTIEEGDIVNVDYVGKLDGEAFEGGTAENQNIDVYNNSSANGITGYIDGFTEGLKGASVGDVIDCDVTFPEDYQAENLAGKAVVFTFTVNSIQKEMELSDVDDAFAKEQFNADTVEDMYAQMQTFLERAAESTKLSDTYSAIHNYLLENCTVEIPEDYLNARVNDYQTQFVNNNLEGDASKLEEYLTTNYGKTLEEAREEWKSGMEQNISLEFIMEAIAEKENVTLDEEGYATYIQNLISNNGYASEEALYKQYGYDDAAYGEAYLRQIYVDNLALEKIREMATVIEANSAETSTEGAGADSTEETLTGSDSTEE